MKKTSRSAAFKKKVALEALRENDTLSALASKYGVHPIQVSQWKKALIDGAESLFEGKRSRRPKNEASREDLERKIGQLSIELDFLKKTLGS